MTQTPPTTPTATQALTGLRFSDYLMAQALRDIAAVLTSSLDLDEVLDHMMEVLEQVVPHDSANVVLMTGQNPEIVRDWANSALNMEIIPAARELTESETERFRLLAESMEPLIIDDTETAAEWRVRAANRWIRAYVAMPMIARDRVIGFLNLNSAMPGFFTQEHVSNLQAFSDLAAIAIENARLYRNLETAYLELQEADKIKSEMIQNVSHELRTPLSLIAGHSALILSDPDEAEREALSEDQTRGLETIQSQSTKLVRIIETFVWMEKTTSAPLERVETSVEELLHNAVESTRAIAEDAELALTCRVDEDMPSVLIDPMAIEHVVVNLLVNAYKFTPAGGQVNVRAWPSADEGKVYVSVTDTGIGIPQEEHERIFERFYQADGSTTREYGGVGLGLALCKSIIEAHDEKIGVRSISGNGTTFIFTLPSFS